MIPQTRRDAIRFAALMERRRAIIERSWRPEIERSLYEVAKVTQDLYLQGGTERLSALLAKEAETIITPVIVGLYDATVDDTRRVADKTSRKVVPFSIERKEEVEEIDIATQLLKETLKATALEQSAIIADGLGESWLIVAETMEDVVAEEGPAVASRRLRDQVEGLSKWKADQIARTETLIAQTESQAKLTETMWEDEDGPMWKEWFPGSDARTRKDHKAMRNVQVPYDQLFTVGGKKMKYPGDRAGGPGQIIACRCSWSVVPYDLVSRRNRRLWESDKDG